jgi:DNA-binding LacI/PurR family transcriptional regulator
MTNDRFNRVTLNDVAHHARTSYQTVSRVINGSPHVSDKTRERVLQAIKELDYHPNLAARTLVTKRSQTLEVITFGAHHYGPAQMVTHIERAARKKGYNLILTNIADMTLDEMRSAIDSLPGRLVDGFIMITPVLGVNDEELSTLCKGIPFVRVDTRSGANAPSVVIDQSYGSYLATQHLIDLGHRDIGEISGPLNWFGGIARHESWLKTMRDNGLMPGHSVSGDWTAIGGYYAAQSLLEQGKTFTALVVGNDQMALGAMRALREQGLRIPDDISIVGFDDVPEAVCYEPPLTTIWQDFGTLGSHTVEYLLSLINNPQSPAGQQIITPQLIVRQSTRSIR